MRELIDTHCHLYLNDFTEDLDRVVQRAVDRGVGGIYLPAISSKEHPHLLDLADRYPQLCQPMMGLHPCSVSQDVETELSVVEKWLSTRKFVAIGEIGLDLHWDTTFFDRQLEAFRIQIKWALERDYPVVIHSRKAIDECLEVVESFKGQPLKGVFHCFSGNLEQAKRITDLGFFLGIGGVVTYKNSGLDILKDVSPQYFVLETDAPYLSPVPFRGKRNESSYLIYIIKRLSEIVSLTEDELASITTSNAQKLFGTS